MAKRAPSFIFTHLHHQFPKPYPLLPARFFTSEISGYQPQSQPPLTNIAGEICEIIRTRPRWEETLISHFPSSFNFFDPRFFNEVLKLQNNAFLSLRLFNWLISHSGFSPDPTSCKSLFNALLEAKASVLAKSFIDSLPQFNPDLGSLESLICCLCNDGFFEEALDLFEKFKSFGVCPSIETWNSALSGAVRFKRTDVAWKLYGEMMGCGVDADVNTVGYLIRAFCIDNNVERGYELVRQVQDGGLALGNVALNRLIYGLSKDGNYDRVSELLHFMIGTNCKPDIYTYQGVIHGLCKRRKEVEGYRIFNDLKARGYSPDRVMYVTMIRGLCRMRWLGEARKLWFEMIRKGMVPNEYAYNVLIHGYCNVYAPEDAWELHEEMCNRGYKLTTVSYNTLIAGLCKNGRLSEACNLFDEMSRSGVARDVITYNSMIKGLCREGNLAKGQLLFEELVARGLLPSVSSYTPLIEQLCLFGSTQQALELWMDMLNMGVEPSNYIYECIINGLCHEGLPVEGMQWLSEMLERKLIPQQKTFERLIESLSQQDKLDAVFFVLNSMLSMGYILGEIVCHSLVSKLSSSSHVETHIEDIISGREVSELCS